MGVFRPFSFIGKIFSPFTRVFRVLSLRLKLAAGFGVVSLIFIAAAGYVLQGLLTASNATKEIVEADFPKLQLMFKLKNIMEAHKANSLTIINPGADFFKREQAKSDLTALDLKSIAKQLEPFLAIKEQKERLQQVVNLDKELQRITTEDMIQAIDAGDFDKATQTVIVNLDALYVELGNIISSLLDEGVKISQQRSTKVIEDNKTKMTAAVFGILFAVILAIVIVLFVTRTITVSLRSVIEPLLKIADGDIAQKELDVITKDEIGQMANSFNKMVQGLGALAKVAENVAEGDIEVEAKIRSDKDILSIAFSKVISSQRELAKSAEMIADGDLTVPVKPRSQKDALANAFVKMIQNLKGLVYKIGEQSDGLTSASINVSKVSEQIAQTSSQQAKAVSQISSSTNQVAKNSQTAATAGGQADSLSKKGRETIDNMLSKMKAIQNSIELSASSMQELAQQSTQIGEIVNVITKIADQTNLLSLNAAIEAARAGEAGRGFAVVADEVRKLAESSTQQSSEISKIIRQVLANTQRVVNAVGEGKKEVEEGGVLVSRSYEIFGQIVQAVENMSQEIQSIASAAEETAATSEEAAAVSQEQSAGAEEMSSSAAQLAASSKILQDAVGVFKIR